MNSSRPTQFPIRTMRNFCLNFWKPGFSSLVVAMVLVAGFATNPSQADVQVTTHNGATIQGDEIGTESNAVQLAIVVKHKRIALTRYRRWNTIRAILIDGQRQNIDLLKKRYSQQKAHPRANFSGHVSVHLPPNQIPKKRASSNSEHKHRQSANSPQANLCRIILGRNAYRPEALYLNPLPVESRILGIRRDPLATYQQEIDRFFPNGITPSEAPFVQDLMRNLKARNVLESPPIRLPNPPKPAGIPQRNASLETSWLLERPIRSIQISAFPVSENGLADWDALDVQLTAFDAQMRPVRFAGTVQFTLYGREQQLLRAAGTRFVAIPGPVKKLASWTRAAHAKTPFPNRIFSATNEDFYSSHFQLPLPASSPEHNLELGPWGELSAQVFVPGQGTFLVHQSAIPLRRTGFIREGLIEETGSRFFPQESTHGRKRGGSPFLGSQSSVRPNGRILSVQP